MNLMLKFYDMETMTQKRLNELALERNTFAKEILLLNKIIEIKNNRIQQLINRTRSARINKAVEFLKNNAIFDTNDKGVNKILLSILLGVDK